MVADNLLEAAGQSRPAEVRAQGAFTQAHAQTTRRPTVSRVGHAITHPCGQEKLTQVTGHQSSLRFETAVIAERTAPPERRRTEQMDALDRRRPPPIPTSRRWRVPQVHCPCTQRSSSPAQPLLWSSQRTAASPNPLLKEMWKRENILLVIPRVRTLRGRAGTRRCVSVR